VGNIVHFAKIKKGRLISRCGIKNYLPIGEYWTQKPDEVTCQKCVIKESTK